MSETPFQGFGKEALPFLKALGFHQNRDWFHDNKKLYESQLREPLIALVGSASARLTDADIPLRGERKTSLFRINRDIRFAKEKHPYNTHVSAVLTRTGTKKDPGGIYMHFEAGNCFLASGLWFPPGPQLKALREQIDIRSSAFLTLVADLEKAGLPILHDQMVTRTPAGFKQVTDETLLYWLKHKSFIIQHTLDEAVIHSDALLDEITTFGRHIMPFMQFVWRAVDPLMESDSAKKGKD